MMTLMLIVGFVVYAVLNYLSTTHLIKWCEDQQDQIAALRMRVAMLEGARCKDE